MAKYLLKKPGVQYLFSERFCQDPVEAFFGRQQASGGRNDNPNVLEFLQNPNSLRLQGSVFLKVAKGNSRGATSTRKRMADMAVDETPLPKRKRL